MIVGSIPKVGLIEPLMVHPQRDKPGTYLLLDGHLRYLALKQLGKTTAECIIATDDECFTYNARVNRVPTIQYHKMIVRAVQNGVKVDKIAGALDMEEKDVRSLITLLDGIDDVAANLLKDKNITPRALRLLRKVAGSRQIEIAEAMVSVNNYAAGYVEGLIWGTPKEQLVNPTAPKEKAGLSVEDVARMEREMESLERAFKAVETNYKENMMTLTVARGYIRKLLDNAQVVRFLKANYPDICLELGTLAAEGV
jgi:hypothetical protein